jgi:uridylate kinase
VKKIVISLGGSILVKGEDDSAYIEDFRNLIGSLSGDHRFIIITGGGRTARDYIKIGRALGSDEATLDWIGISATRLNAWLVISAFGPECYPKPVMDIEDAIKAAGSFRFVIGGGTHPGHTTDAVAALIAERWGADKFLNLTAVNGAYTDDPNKVEDAKKIDRIKTSELVELVSHTTTGAGSHSVMDPLASRIIHRARLSTSILNGRDLVSLRRCIVGDTFDGTVVEPDGEGG